MTEIPKEMDDFRKTLCPESRGSHGEHSKSWFNSESCFWCGTLREEEDKWSKQREASISRIEDD